MVYRCDPVSSYLLRDWQRRRVADLPDFEAAGDIPAGSGCFVMSDHTFDALVWRAAGCAPYPYQRRLALEGLPELLEAPTGAGKTLAAVLPWLYRRRFHPDARVRGETPRRLVLVLPQRALVEQTERQVRRWLGALDLADEVALQVLMGGMDRRDRSWQTAVNREVVLVGTQDMVLSRALMRGYGEARAAWPVSFGLLHTDSQFVFDEVQLMGPGLATSLQLEGLRREVGTARRSATMWMSATLDRGHFDTPDLEGDVLRAVSVEDDDRKGGLGQRLAATRSVVPVVLDDPKRYERSLARWLIAEHRPGTRTIAVLNTVERAQNVYAELLRDRQSDDVVLLHSRFRPADRTQHLERALAAPAAAGTIVVATQVLEAGIDVDSRLLLTESAPWSSVVQRAGRCNRSGDYDDAVFAWVCPPKGRGWAAPYQEKDLEAAGRALADLAGQRVTSIDLQRLGVEEQRPLHAVLRRRDLFDLFDTSPDLSGNDIDISRWVRDADATTAQVLWRDWSPDGPPPEASTPAREELCPVPLAGLRALLADGRRAWVFDQTDTQWRPARPDDVRPGATVVLDAAEGGYLPGMGWRPSSAVSVRPVSVAPEEPDGLGSDPLSRAGEWVSLHRHLDDVRDATAALLDRLAPLDGLTEAQRRAAIRAGALHDLGKAHPVFAESLARLGEPPAGEPGPWAKSGVSGRLRHSRPAFRHELVSALLALDSRSGLLAGEPEADLVAYLMAAHHGKVRLAVRSAPSDAGGHVLGVGADDVPPVVLGDGRSVPRLTLNLDILLLGGDGANESWVARTCRLRDRPDLGPFRLAFLEAVVRLADWTASASYGEAS